MTSTLCCHVLCDDFNDECTVLQTLYLLTVHTRIRSSGHFGRTDATEGSNHFFPTECPFLPAANSLATEGGALWKQEERCRLKSHWKADPLDRTRAVMVLASPAK